MTLLVLLVLGLGPVSAFLGIVLQQALTMSDQAIPWLNQHLGAATAFNVQEWGVKKFPALAKYMPSQEQLLQQVATAAKAAGTFLVGFASRMTATTAAFLLNLFVMLYAMFFFFRDGHKILERIFYYTPLSDEDETRMLTPVRFDHASDCQRDAGDRNHSRHVGRHRILGSRNRGSSSVGNDHDDSFHHPRDRRRSSVGAGSHHSVHNGQYLTATLLAAWCAAVVGTVDNFLRPSAGRQRRENAGPSHSDWHTRRIVPLRADRIHRRTDRLRTVSYCLGHLRRHFQGSPAAGNKLPSIGPRNPGNRPARTSGTMNCALC